MPLTNIDRSGDNEDLVQHECEDRLATIHDTVEEGHFVFAIRRQRFSIRELARGLLQLWNVLGADPNHIPDDLNDEKHQNETHFPASVELV